jgi:lysylphosphatidylglycerol synthetase-like protein (DUF2156 family)
LILEAMRLVKADGAELVSLGLAPLAGLDASPDPRWLTRVLHWYYRNGGITYGFQPLHAFKMKFHPTRVEPRYLAHCGRRLRLRHVRGVYMAVLGNLAAAVASSFARRLKRLDWIAALETRLGKDYVLRPTPRTHRELALRLPFTLLVGALLVAGMGLGKLSVGLSWLLLPFGVGTLEYFRGTLFTAAVFTTASLFGAAMGLLGCVGALLALLRRQRGSTAALVVVLLAVNLLSSDHVAAVVVGVFLQEIA